MLSSVRLPVRRLFSSIACANIYTNVDMIQVNSQFQQLLKTDHLSIARKVFEEMPHRDEVTWTLMISGYVKALCSREALALFSCMWVEPGLRMDPFVLSLALKACGSNGDVNYGKALHGYSVKTGFVSSVFVGSSLLDMYVKSGKIDLSCRVFDEMPMRNVVSWTAIITGLVRAGYNKEGLAYFSDMLKSRVVYGTYTLSIALKACAELGALNSGREIHTQALKRGFDESSSVANTLVSLYNRCGKLEYGLRLFERMRMPDVISWTAIITAYVQKGLEEHAVEAFRKMREIGVSPNEFTFASVISGCAGLARLEWGKQLHAHVLRLGLKNHLSVSNSIMAMYSRCGQLTSASRVFSMMARRDIVSWSTIIAAYSQGGHGEEALKHLSWMRREGAKPNEFTLASVLSMCSHMGLFDLGKQLHAHVMSIGLEHTDLVQSSLINMYTKCGNIMEASKIFDEAGNNIVTWTAMINGYAEHGYSQEAIDLFEKMRKIGLRPDPVTFIGVLTACSHAGFVELGFHYFNAMKEYHINPSKEHQGCMIDLLCRAGRLSDAEHMIEHMTCQKNDVVWSTLLRACRVHGDVDRGRRAAENILSWDPNCAGTHITLANLYAAKGRWREAAEVRKDMRSKGLMKEPGCSWIKHKGQVSTFVAGDQSHPQGDDIYSVLALLASSEESVHEIVSLLNYS